MVKLKYNPLEDGLPNQSVANFFKSLKRTTTNKNEEKELENGEIIEFSKKITNDNININRTEEATESPKANTETTEEMDEREDSGVDKKTENNQSTNGIGDEADDTNKNKNKKQNKNKDNDNQEAHFNKRTEKMISTEDNKEAINNKSGLLQHANRLHANGAAAARRSEEEEKLAQSTKEVVTVVTNNDQGPTIND